MAPRKPFLLRLDPSVHDALASWAADEFRSVNGQIEFLLRDALRRGGRKVVARADDEPAIASDAEPQPEAPAAGHAGARGTSNSAAPRDARAPDLVEPQADGA